MWGSVETLCCYHTTSKWSWYPSWPHSPSLQVEAGQLEDSPKLAALQRLLAGIAALLPVRFAGQALGVERALQTVHSPCHLSQL